MRNLSQPVELRRDPRGTSPKHPQRALRALPGAAAEVGALDGIPDEAGHKPNRDGWRAPGLVSVDALQKSTWNNRVVAIRPVDLQLLTRTFE